MQSRIEPFTEKPARSALTGFPAKANIAPTAPLWYVRSTVSNLPGLYNTGHQMQNCSQPLSWSRLLRFLRNQWSFTTTVWLGFCPNTSPSALLRRRAVAVPTRCRHLFSPSLLPFPLSPLQPFSPCSLGQGGSHRGHCSFPFTGDGKH